MFEIVMILNIFICSCDLLNIVGSAFAEGRQRGLSSVYVATVVMYCM